MSGDWQTTEVADEAHALSVLENLNGRRGMYRGQSKRYRSLLPSIERDGRLSLSRSEKLRLERRSIELFRSTARFFANSGEEGALRGDIVALMVLRHHRVSTRFLDWSTSPCVAAYFAAGCDDSEDEEDGEVWSFDMRQYTKKGAEQWRRWPETTTDGSGNPDKFEPAQTAFLDEEPPDWFVCEFYGLSFPRQTVQAGAYTLTAQFGRDHAASIASLLEDPSSFHLYVIKAALKARLREVLRDEFGISRASLFPDVAGSAAMVRQMLFGDKGT